MYVIVKCGGIVGGGGNNKHNSSITFILYISLLTYLKLNTIGQLPQISGNIDSATQVRTAIII
jgi:hypothetical protein